MRLLLLGATGLVGRTILSQALAKDAISEVVAPTRSPLVPQNKLVNPVNLRLDELAPREYTPSCLREGGPRCRCRNVRPRVRHWSRDQLYVLLCQDQRRSGERHSANRLPLPYDLPTKHYRWQEKRNADCRGYRFGYLASVGTHFAEKVSCQSGSCHRGILARFSSHSETRLPLGLCRRA